MVLVTSKRHDIALCFCWNLNAGDMVTRVRFGTPPLDRAVVFQETEDLVYTGSSQLKNLYI